MEKCNLYYFCHSLDLKDWDEGEVKQIIDLEPDHDQEFGADLIQQENGEFRVSQIGEFRPFLAGYQYTLMDQHLFTAINQIAPNQIQGSPTTINRLATKEKWENYLNVNFLNAIKQNEDIENLSFNGKKVFLYADSFIIVTKDLALELQEFIKSNYPKYCFTQSFPLFVG
tara:strand:- start:64 stop:573 length:510 start_codon:yes stop_codon:yes gene_type:complete